MNPLQQHAKLIFSSIVILILAVGGFYLVEKSKKVAVPINVLVPRNYPEGTKVALYDTAPAGFPSEIILEGQPIKYAGTVTTIGDRKQMTVSYVSPRSIADVANLYFASLPKNNFVISNRTVSAKIAVISATRGYGKLTITISPFQGGSNMVTLQYNQ